MPDPREVIAEELRPLVDEPALRGKALEEYLIHEAESFLEALASNGFQVTDLTGEEARLICDERHAKTCATLNNVYPPDDCDCPVRTGWEKLERLAGEGG